jgi:hypothetical protein
LGEGLVTAVIAFAARDVMKNDDAISGMEVAQVLADGGDDAGSFVSENAGCGVRAGRNFLEVGAADAASMHTEKEFAWTDFGNRNGFEADVVLAAIDRG